ncbi:unnamed protein product [Polarella glacialis]|uniref:Exonuclease domain-containing protein n=1 Tax=Polarella glacialis TaxID=89957 RepID=A0A813FQL1_POLGL|nr:unnamed protein product [Polarella glacialis]
MTPHTVLVGHTLNKDLQTLKFDAPLLVDIALLFGIQSMPKRRPALAHLVHYILGRGNFRGEDGTAAHNCADDVTVTMELFLHRLRSTPPGQELPSFLWVPPPPVGELDENARTLYVHRIPERPGVFAAVTALFTGLPNASSLGLEALNMIGAPIEAQLVTHKLRGATAVFASKSQAEQAFLALPFESIEIDSAQRPQKLVRLQLADGGRSLVCVRPILGGIGNGAITEDANTVVPKHTDDRKPAVPKADGKREATTAAAAATPPARAAAKAKAAEGSSTVPAAADGKREATTAAAAATPPARAAAKAKAAEGSSTVPAAALAAVAKAAARKASFGPDSNGKRKGWPGWRRAMDEELKTAAGGAMPWKKLRTALVARRREQVGGKPGEAEEPEELLGARAMAAVPEEYLSSMDSLVRFVPASIPIVDGA